MEGLTQEAPKPAPGLQGDPAVDDIDPARACHVILESRSHCGSIVEIILSCRIVYHQ